MNLTWIAKLLRSALRWHADHLRSRPPHWRRTAQARSGRATKVAGAAEGAVFALGDCPGFHVLRRGLTLRGAAVLHRLGSQCDAARPISARPAAGGVRRHLRELFRRYTGQPRDGLSGIRSRRRESEAGRRRSDAVGNLEAGRRGIPTSGRSIPGSDAAASGRVERDDRHHGYARDGDYQPSPGHHLPVARGHEPERCDADRIRHFGQQGPQPAPPGNVLALGHFAGDLRHCRS